MSASAALTILNDGQALVTLYLRQNGGFHSFGLPLARFLSRITMVNGTYPNATVVADGMGDLAVQIICHFKREQIGELYIIPPDLCPQEDYIYTVDLEGPDQLVMTAETWDHNDKFFGRPACFDWFLIKLSESVED